MTIKFYLTSFPFFPLCLAFHKINFKEVIDIYCKNPDFKSQ